MSIVNHNFARLYSVSDKLLSFVISVECWSLVNEPTQSAIDCYCHGIIYSSIWRNWLEKWRSRSCQVIIHSFNFVSWGKENSLNYHSPISSNQNLKYFQFHYGGTVSKADTSECRHFCRLSTVLSPRAEDGQNLKKMITERENVKKCDMFI